ncbi:MAG: methyl-accepting chemotaxis protein [Planctomycetota bacterium]
MRGKGKSLSVAARLGLGFGGMVVLAAVMGAVSLMLVGSIQRTQQSAFGNAVPASQIALDLKGEVHHALSMHRGYMILGLQALSDERLETWDRIDGLTVDLGPHVERWDDHATRALWSELQTVMVDFRAAQDRIAAVSFTEDNIPATRLYYNEGEPQGDQMLVHLNAILEMERAQTPSHERLDLAVQIGAAKAHLLRSRNAISSFMVSGTAKARELIDHEVGACAASVAKLRTMGHLLTADQHREFEAYLTTRARYLELAEESVALRDRSDYCVSEDICLNTVTPLANRAIDILGTISGEAELRADAAEAEITSTIAGMWWKIIGLTGGLVVLGSVMGWLIARSIITPIRAVSDSMQQIADGDGDLSRRVEHHANDELGELVRSLNALIGKVQSIVISVSDVANDVAGSSIDLKTNSDEMSRELHNQLQQVRQISAASEEMSTSVTEVADNSKTTAERATSAGDMAVDGGEIVNQNIDEMRAIANSVEETATRIESLSERGDQIGQVIEVINDIADQTNLLALNAAIEAARAGEHGRGFAVVADEVRKLADRTTVATEEIAEQIGVIRNETRAASEQMSQGLDRVRAGVGQAEQAGQSLSTIVTGSREVSERINAIANTCEQQAAASEEVSQSVVSMTETISRSSDTASATAEAVARVASKADELKSLMARFNFRNDND